MIVPEGNKEKSQFYQDVFIVRYNPLEIDHQEKILSLRKNKSNVKQMITSVWKGPDEKSSVKKDE